MYNDVVVSATGVLTAIGEGVGAFSEALRAGRCGMAMEDSDVMRVAARIAEVPFEERLVRLNLPPAVLERARRAGRTAPRSLQVSLVTVLEAWKRGGFDGATLSAEDVNLVVAGHNFNQWPQHAMAEKHRDNPEYVPARQALHFMDTDHVGVISEVLGLRGEGCTVGGASASGNVGLIHAFRQVRAGLCRACVVVAPLADLSPVEIQAFRQLGAMGGLRFGHAPEKACRPFDADREGFVFGEGSACVIVESAESATRRNAPVLGRIAGAAICLDGNRLADPSVDGEVRAMRKALQDANVAAGSVEYVNPHATSSVLGDDVEARALHQVFGAGVGQVWINATKGLTGHCLYSASLVEAVAVLIQMQEGFLHPNRNLENPSDPRLRYVGATSVAARPRIALSNAFGFGGINTSVVFSA